MQKLLIGVVLVLVVVAVAMLGWSTGEEAGGVIAVDENEEAVARDETSGSQIAPAVGDAAANVVDSTKSSAVPEGLFRTEVEAGTGNVLAIQVWDRQEGAAAASAEVFVLGDLGNGEVDWGFTEGPFRHHWSTIAERQGRRVHTDEDGRVEVPDIEGNAVVAAKLPGAYAFAWVDDERDEDHVETLVLRADETLTVRVTNAAGEPVLGVAVGMLQRILVQGELAEMTAKLRELEKSIAEIVRWMEANPADAGRASEKLDGIRREYGGLRREADAAKRQRQTAIDVRPATRAEVRARRRTSEDGLAVFEHFQFAREVKKRDRKKKGKPPAPPSPLFEAALLVPLQEPVTTGFSIEALPEDVIELRMPETGSVALRTVDRDGRPFTHPVRGELRVVADDHAEWARVMLRKEQNERTIEFPHVGLGMTFDARCRLDDDDFRWEAPAFAGPTAPGDRVEVDLVVAPDAGMLYARLLNGDGVAIAGVSPTFLINAASGRLEGEEVITDDEGRFHLPYAVRSDQRPPYRLEIRRDDVEPTAGLAMPLAGLPQAVVTDLGDLVIDAFGEIVHGTVVDDAGEPIAGAEVRLQRERPAGKGGSLRFVDEAFVRTESDEAGRFALFGLLESGRYRLRAEADDHFDATESLIAAGRVRSLRLTRKCRVVGTVIAPEWMNRERVRVDLTPVRVSADSERAKPRNDQIQDYQGKTYAYFDWVRPGTYALAFRLQGFPDAFLTIPELSIEPGQVDLHPQLRDLDLGAYLFRFEIYPVDEIGQPVDVDRPQLTKITRSNGDEQFLGLVMKGRSGEVFSTTPQLEVYPMCEGYVAEPQVLAAGRCEIVFRSIPPVDLVLGGLASIAGEVPVQVVLERLELDGRPETLEAFDGMSKRIAGWYARARYSAAMLDAVDTARVEVTASGLHKAFLRFGAGQIKQPTTVELDAVDIAIQPGGRALRVPVSFDVDVVRQAATEAAARM